VWEEERGMEAGEFVLICFVLFCFDLFCMCVGWWWGMG
jgi:hypothetical protein